MEQLLQDNFDVSTLGLSNQVLVEFLKAHYSGASYCRFPNCPRGEVAFQSTKQRDQHELAHLPRYQCTKPQCAWRGQGFKTQKLLKIHDQKYHPDLQSLAVPQIPTTWKQQQQQLSQTGMPGQQLPGQQLHSLIMPTRADISRLRAQFPKLEQMSDNDIKLVLINRHREKDGLAPNNPGTRQIQPTASQQQPMHYPLVPRPQQESRPQSRTQSRPHEQLPNKTSNRIWTTNMTEHSPAFQEDGSSAFTARINDNAPSTVPPLYEKIRHTAYKLNDTSISTMFQFPNSTS